MRSQKDVDNSNRHNETKAKILFLLIKAKRYLTSPQISKKCDLSKNNASRQMIKLTGQGYVWRKEIKNDYGYKFLKPLGIRTCRELWLRMRMKEQTEDPRITLNLKKKIPFEHQELYEELSRAYYKWLWER